MNIQEITVRINGTVVEADVEPRILLSDYLRHYVGLKGTRVGCEQGVCGACTVLLDGSPVRSCLVFAVQTDNCDVESVESLSYHSDGGMHPLQTSFMQNHALQCGFCTSGFLMTLAGSYDVLRGIDETEARELLSGNVCRCTGYEDIVNAVLDVTQEDDR